MSQSSYRRPLFRRKWFLIFATLVILVGVPWGSTYLFGSGSVEKRFLELFPKTMDARDGQEVPFEVRLNSEFEGQGLDFRAIDPPDSDAYVCLGKPRVVAPLLVEIEYEWSGPGPFDGSAFRLTFLWTPWKSYLVGQKRHWVR